MTDTDATILRTLAILPARGWRYSLFASLCDADGSTHVFTLWRHETEGKGQRYPFTAQSPAGAIGRGLAWLETQISDRGTDAISPLAILGGQGRSAASLCHNARVVCWALVALGAALLLAAVVGGCR